MTARLWGQQILVNTQVNLSQDRPAITTLNDGRIVVVWRDSGTANGDVMARIFNANGTPASGELPIGTGALAQSHPTVTALGNGGFMVAYQESSYVAYRAYSSAGVFEAANSGTLLAATLPAIVGTGSGASFNMVATQGTSLIVAQYNSGGDVITSQVGNFTASSKINADLAYLDTAETVFVWLAEDNTVMARILGPGGDLENNQVFVSTGTSPTATAEPKVTALAYDTYLVTWHANGYAYPASNVAIWGRLITSFGIPWGDPFLVSSRYQDAQTYSDVVALKDGGFMFVWADGGNFLRAQVFNVFGERMGREITVNSTGTIFSSFGIETTLLADGRVAVVWNGFGLQGDSDGIAMQIIDPRDGYIDGTLGTDVLYGHDTVGDVVLALAGGDTVYGLGGADSIYAGDGADFAYGGTGDDVISGGLGGDFISGDAGDDLLYGDLGEDIVGGGAGIDLIFGGGGNDWLEGGEDADTMLGEGGGDRLNGGDGNDVLDGGIGDDVMIGGTGNDIIYVDSLGDQVIEQPGGGIDIVYSSVNWLGNANVENLVLTGNAALNATMNGDANLVAGNGAANVINGAGGNDTIDGLGGNDWLGGGDGADRLDGGADNDTIQGGVGADSLYGGSGADSFYYGSYLDSNAAQGIDSIQDFQIGVDKINLAPARLSPSDSVTIVPAYGNAYVFVDLYGDGINDMIIEVIGATTLSGADLNF